MTSLFAQFKVMDSKTNASNEANRGLEWSISYVLGIEFQNIHPFYIRTTRGFYQRSWGKGQGTSSTEGILPELKLR